mgnify:CR=1 FL=1
MSEQTGIKPAGKKATAAEIEERVTVVYTLLIRGASRDEILRHGAEKWTLATRQMEDYLARATERLKALAAYVHEEELGRARAQLHDLYGKNMKVQDYKAALQVRKDLSELLGLYAPKVEKHEHTGRDGAPMSLLVGRLEADPEELRRRLLAEAEAAEGDGAPRPDPPEAD